MPWWPTRNTTPPKITYNSGLVRVVVPTLIKSQTFQVSQEKSQEKSGSDTTLTWDLGKMLPYYIYNIVPTSKWEMGRTLTFLGPKRPKINRRIQV